MHIPPPASHEARALARTLGLCATTGALLERKGITSDEPARRFLSPRLSQLTSPETMAGRDAAADRLARAVTAGERIAVFGDYDCDGITAAAIITDALRRLGGQAMPFLASRFGGGYGLSQPALARVLESSPSLLVTCDCGSADGPRVAEARARGVDVIVIDHHLVPDEPLDAVAFLNPHRPDCGFPYKGLASCGLALSVAAALRAKLKANLDPKLYLDLVAIGTIADVAPLDGDNRALVRAGLEAIRASARPGLKALLEHGRVDVTQPLTGEDVAFKIAPRLNAPGRLASPDIVLSLLLARDLTEARSLAAACEQANERRKELQARIVDEATAMATAQKVERRAGVVLASKGWHHGIVGIVAGRMADTLKRPVIVGSIDEGVATCSVRSARGVDIHAALTRCRDVLRGFGGHAKAAGCTFDEGRLGDLVEAFDRACAELTTDEASRRPAIEADALLDEGDDPSIVLRELALFEPCGEANRAPRLCLTDAKVRAAREVRGGHLKLDLERSGRIISGFGLNLGQVAGQIGKRVHVIGSLRRDDYRGGDAVEVRVDEVAPA